MVYIFSFLDGGRGFGWLGSDGGEGEEWVEGGEDAECLTANNIFDLIYPTDARRRPCPFNEEYPFAIERKDEEEVEMDKVRTES